MTLRRCIDVNERAIQEIGRRDARLANSCVLHVPGAQVRARSLMFSLMAPFFQFHGSIWGQQPVPLQAVPTDTSDTVFQ